MHWVELIGYAGTTLTIVAYAMRSSLKLRIAGVLSSIAFLTYGGLTASYPVMLMELVLLPLNLWRLWQMVKLMRAVVPGNQAVGLDWLTPHMLRVHVAQGTSIFAHGERADRLMVVLDGTVVWDGRALGPGAIVGDSALFDAGRVQTGSATATSAAVIAVMPKARLAELYFENPAFGCRLVQLLLDGMTRELQQSRAAPLALAS